jgi:hypothetical protein
MLAEATGWDSGWDRSMIQYLNLTGRELAGKAAEIQASVLAAAAKRDIDTAAFCARWDVQFSAKRLLWLAGSFGPVNRGGSYGPGGSAGRRKIVDIKAAPAITEGDATTCMVTLQRFGTVVVPAAKDPVECYNFNPNISQAAFESQCWSAQERADEEYEARKERAAEREGTLNAESTRQLRVRQVSEGGFALIYGEDADIVDMN